MPTYQYACTECGHKLEAVQSFTDAPLAVCPECSGRLRKLFSSVGIVFKGSGFYRNDSRADASGSTAAKPDAPAKTGAKESTSANGKDSGGRDSGGSKDSGSKDSGGAAKSDSSSSSTSGSSGSSSSSSTAPAGAAA